MMESGKIDLFGDVIAKLKQINLPFLFVTLLLSFIGVAMQYSASGGNIEPYAGSHLIKLVMALVIMFGVAMINPRILLAYAYHIYIAGFMLLLVVEIFGHIGMGAQRWVRIGGLNLQPSEIMKIFVILALARFYHHTNAEDVDRKMLTIPPLMLIAMPAGLILIQPNLGTATITTAIGVAILFAAGIKIWKFIAVGATGIAMLPIAWQFLHDYQKRRVMTFLDPESDPLGAGYNIMQSKIAIGSGGIFGKGFLEGSQSQLSFLPEKQTDFIFTMLTEEFGLVGGLITIGLFLTLILMCLWIGMSSRHHFGRIICVGVSAMLFLHFLINIAMVMGLIPVVGVPLPLLSFGGSITVSSLMGIGLVMNAHINRESLMGKAVGMQFR